MRRSSRSSRLSSLDTPGASPASISAWRTHLRSVSGFIPNRPELPHRRPLRVVVVAVFADQSHRPGLGVLVVPDRHRAILPNKGSAHKTGDGSALREIYNAEDIDKAQLAIKAFEIDYGAKYPKAVAKILDDADVLLEFYRYPAEHWVHLRTTNPIESTFATVRLRTKVTKGPGSRAAGIAMAYKLIEAAQTRWRAVNAPHLVALVRAGAVFHKGKLLERPVNITPAEPGESTETDVA